MTRSRLLSQAHHRQRARLDHWVEPLLNNARTRTPVIAVTDGLPDDDGNPHLWFDVALATAYVKRIRDGLVAAIPADGDRYRSARTPRRARHARRRAQDEGGTIPAYRRKLVTSHDAFPYFAKAYGFTVVGFAQPEAGKSLRRPSSPSSSRRSRTSRSPRSSRRRRSRRAWPRRSRARPASRRSSRIFPRTASGDPPTPTRG